MPLDFCEYPIENYDYIEKVLNDLVHTISFSRLKILISPIANPTYLVEVLHKTAPSVHKNNMPLPTFPAQ